MIARVLIDFKDRATPEVNRVISAMKPDKVAPVIGPRLRETVRDHLKQNPRNKKGWPSTGFWEDAARATTWTADGSTVTIKINKVGVRQRYYGGPIKPVHAKFLTIPIASQAYGKTVADFPGSFLITTAKGEYIVQYAGSIGKRGRANKSNSTLEFLFKLSKGVMQHENRSIIPDSTTLTATAIKACEEHFRRAKAGGA
ncbi:MAG: hypothetical protein HOP33_09000 [Verrucomicrobia bacterium]|nr:hypothetical protein [Verrucomicrobiota bacterium]